MSDIIFKTEFKTGAKGDQGNAGTSFEVPTGAIMAYDGANIPEGYIETEVPSGEGLLTEIDITQEAYYDLPTEQREDGNFIYFIIGDTIEYFWNFCESLTDVVEGEVAEINAGASRDSSGVLINTAGELKINVGLLGKALEIQFGSITSLEAIGKIITSGGDSDFGIGINGTQLYVLNNGEWQGVPFTDNFSNATLYMTFPDANSMKLYYNGELLYDGITFLKSGATYFTIGFNEGCAHPLRIKSLAITELGG
jgi:hypothetical protein